MKRIKMLSLPIVCLFVNALQAQKAMNCEHCNMNINDELHRAVAIVNNTTKHFDAIECLINYLKDQEEKTFSQIQVADYETGKLIDANTAHYLKSAAIPSPMGANLSAFKNKQLALQTQQEKGGELFTWKTIKEKFKNTKFGAINHSHHNHYRPDAHAPIGVMGDHLHAKGGLMVSFRYMNMNMDGNKSGTSSVSNNEIYNNYMVAPQQMTMNMYMLGIMYAPSSKLTLMLMQNFANNNMDLTARMMMPNNMIMLREFSTSSSGLGDLKLSALYGLIAEQRTSLHLNIGANIPIGDIKNRDNTPMMDNAKLPYAMQLGTGTFDATIGGTYKENYTNMSWGSQLLSTFRFGENGEGYRFGNTYQLNIWGAYKVFSNVSVSGRVLGELQGELEGLDPELNPMMVTTANTNNYGSDKIKSFVGVNVVFPQTSSFKDFKFGVEVGLPIYENYNGVQMDEDLTVNFGVKYNIL